MPGDTVTVYDIDFDKEFFEALEEKISSVDPTQNYGKKHTVKQACKTAVFLLEEKHKEYQADIDGIKREMADLEEVLSK